MAKATVTFNRLVQDSQDYGSNDEHMVSRVFFTLEIDGTKHELYADIKQTVGSSYETGPIEVSKPHGYSGPFSHQEFQRAEPPPPRPLLQRGDNQHFTTDRLSRANY